MQESYNIYVLVVKYVYISAIKYYIIKALFSLFFLHDRVILLRRGGLGTSNYFIKVRCIKEKEQRQVTSRNQT